MNYPVFAFTQCADILEEVSEEIGRQLNKWGEQNHPSGTGPGADMLHDMLNRFDLCPGEAKSNLDFANLARKRTDHCAEAGNLTYEMILTEEYGEALAEEEGPELFKELIQVAAVAASWAGAIKRRGNHV